MFMITSLIVHSQSNEINVSGNQTNRYSLIYPETDSFTFCSKTFLIPEEARYSILKKNDSLITNQGSISFIQGCLFHWEYLTSEEEARNKYHGFLENLERTADDFSKKPIKCVLENKEVDGLKISFRSKTRNKHFKILTYGLINGQWVVVYISSQYEIKRNRHIEPIIRQFLCLSK